MKVKDGIMVDWAWILLNIMCSELNRWTNMQEKMQASESMKKRKNYIIHHWFWRDYRGICFKRIQKVHKKKQRIFRKS